MTGTAEAAKPIASVAWTTNGNCRILGTASNSRNAVRSTVSTVPVRDAARETGRAVVWGAERTDIAGSWMTFGRLRQGRPGGRRKLIGTVSAGHRDGARDAARRRGTGHARARSSAHRRRGTGRARRPRAGAVGVDRRGGGAAALDRVVAHPVDLQVRRDQAAAVAELVELDGHVHRARRLGGGRRGAPPLLAVEVGGDLVGGPLHRPVVPLGGVDVDVAVELRVLVVVVHEHLGVLAGGVAVLHEVDLAAVAALVLVVGPEQQHGVVVAIARRRPHPGLPAAVHGACAPGHALGVAVGVAVDREDAVGDADGRRGAPAVAVVTGPVV